MKFSAMALQVALVALMITSCGKKEEDDVTTQFVEAILEDDTATAGFIEDAASELLGGASSGDHQSQLSEAALRAATQEVSGIQVLSKSCVASAGTAVVAVSANVARDNAREGKFLTTRLKVDGTAKQTRNWSHTSSEVDCDTSGRHAQLLLQEPVGLALAMDIEHDLTIEWNVTVNSSGRNFVRTNVKKMLGTRSATFDSVSTTGNDLVVGKTVTSNVNHSDKITRSNGSIVERSYVIKTVDGQPLKTTIVRDISNNYSLSRQTIASGAMEAIGESGSKVTTTAANLVFDHEAAGCVLQSGTLSLTFTDKDDSQLAAISCSVEENELNCTDEDGRLEISAPRCDKSNQV